MSKEILSTQKTSSSIISNIRQALTLNEDDKNSSLNLETSKVSTDSTISDTSTNSKEKESNINETINDYYSSFDYFQFEQNFKKYYVDSSKNNNGNYDNYVKNALKLISLIPYHKLNISEKIKEIQKNLNNDIPSISRSNFNSNKKLLILDIDETLVHSDLDFSLKEKKEVKYDSILHFNSYADVVIDYLEKDKKYFKMRLYRNHCIFIEPGLYIKDLRIFSGIKKLEDIIILDNSLFSFANQLNNGILITSFFSDMNDTFLENVKCYLNYIKNEKDIRIINKKSFRFEEIKEDIIRNDN